MQKWKKCFPDKESPDLVCLDKTSDHATLKDTLEGVKSDIAVLKEKLSQKEFIGSFLNAILQRGSTESQLDEIIPIVIPEGESPFKDIGLYKTMAEGGQYYSPVAMDGQFYSNQLIETDLDMYVNKDSKPNRLRKKCNLTGSGRLSPSSDCSSGSTSFEHCSKPPIPIPRSSRCGPIPVNSIKCIRREAPRIIDGLDTVIKTDQGSEISRSDRAFSDTTSPTHPMTTFGDRHSNMKADSLLTQGSFSYQNKGITDEEKVKLGYLKGHLNNSAFDRLNSQNDDDEASESDDEAEPVYYNLMCVAQQQINRSHMSIDNTNLRESIYASVDVHKRQVEQDAHQLSHRFSSYQWGSRNYSDGRNPGTMTVGRSFTARPHLSSTLAEIEDKDIGM